MRLEDISIKKKLLFTFLSLIFLVVVSSLFNFRIIRNLNQVNDLKITVAEIQQSLNEARKAEKDFILYESKQLDFLESKSSATLVKHAELTGKIDSELRDLLLSNQLSVGYQSLLQSILFANVQYNEAFLQLVDLLHIRGFKDHGLEGEMRSYVHALQQCETSEEQVFAYSLRRHEKDFVLRKDLNYQKKLHATADEFIAYVQDELDRAASYKSNTVRSIIAYRSHFDKIVEIEKQIGLDYDLGLNGQLLKAAASFEPKVKDLYSLVAKEKEELYQQALFIFLSLLAFIVITSVFLNRFINLQLSKRIRILDEVTSAVLNKSGDVEERLKQMISKDELGSLANHFHLMLAQTKEQMDMIHQKNAALELSAEEEKIRSWHVEGLAKFSDLMKINDITLNEMAERIISQLVKYIGANQAAFFVRSNESEKLEMLACYAYERKKYINKAIEKGEGMLGQLWLEKETIYLTEIPDEYIHISSGLGDARPKSLLLIPILTENTFEGAIEIASFEKLPGYKISFVEELANKLASVIHAIKMQEQTRSLLETSQQMTEELRAQEEEMRQNMEELHATQEEMQRNAKEMQQKLSVYQLNSNVLEEVISKVYEGIVVLDKQSNVRFINEKAKQYFDVEASFTEGNNVQLPENLSQVLRSRMGKIENDPAFLVTGFSESFMIELESSGAAIFEKKMLKMVFSKVNLSAEQHPTYVLLINSANMPKGRKHLHRLLS